MESKSLQLLSPITGKTIPLTEVSDPVFSTVIVSPFKFDESWNGLMAMRARGLDGSPYLNASWSSWFTR